MSEQLLPEIAPFPYDAACLSDDVEVEARLYGITEAFVASPELIRLEMASDIVELMSSDYHIGLGRAAIALGAAKQGDVYVVEAQIDKMGPSGLRKYQDRGYQLQELATEVLAETHVLTGSSRVIDTAESMILSKNGLRGESSGKAMVSSSLYVLADAVVRRAEMNPLLSSDFDLNRAVSLLESQPYIVFEPLRFETLDILLRLEALGSPQPSIDRAIKDWKKADFAKKDKDLAEKRYGEPIAIRTALKLAEVGKPELLEQMRVLTEETVQKLDESDIRSFEPWDYRGDYYRSAEHVFSTTAVDTACSLQELGEAGRAELVLVRALARIDALATYYESPSGEKSLSRTYKQERSMNNLKLALRQIKHTATTSELLVGRSEMRRIPSARSGIDTADVVADYKWAWTNRVNAKDLSQDDLLLLTSDLVAAKL